MSDPEVTSEHTFTRASQVLEDVESLRLEMGRNKDSRRPMLVRDASPREVYYHAQTIHRKADHLCVELGAPPVALPPAPPPTQLRPADVLSVLDATRARLAEARRRLHLEGDADRPALPGPLAPTPGKEASDVLAVCLYAGRQLNVMLSQAFNASDGHARLATALALTERLLARHGAALPPSQPLERRKFPRDVYNALWKASETLRQVLLDSGLRALEFRDRFAGEEPGDVYDMASLLVSELEYLWSLVPAAGPATLQVPAPAPTLPAHNYQLACRLQAAVARLADAVRARPGWLAD